MKKEKIKLLVKFIAVDNKVQIDNNYDYINKIYRSIDSEGLIKSLEIDPDAAPFGAGAIKELDDEGRVFLLEFEGNEGEKSNNWSIYFVYGTYINSKQLEVSIYSDTYGPSIEKIYLEKLKLVIKKSINRDWEKIIWLSDKDSECLSIHLYSKIYKVENLMREVINEVMTKQYGIIWWDTFVPAKIKKKHSDRLQEYKAKVQAFRDVDERLMSIDIDDLGTLIKFKRYKWNPVFDEKINAYISGIQSYNEGSVIEKLLNQKVLEIDLWEEQFSKYLPKDFNGRYAVFTKDRNHVMHNKLIDRSAFKTINDSVERIEEDLVKAIKKIQDEILSNEEILEIEKQKKIERMMLEELDHDCRENDSGVSIRNNHKIEALFDESIAEFFTEFEEKLRFRNDIEIQYQYEGNGDNGKLFSVKSSITQEYLEFYFDMDICDDEGSESTLAFYCSNSDFKVYLKYQNGAVELDYDSGLYMPVTEDSIGDIANIIDEIIDFINMELPSYLEQVNPKDIGQDLICCECGTESICINEDILPIGTCLNCGYLNEVRECDRCHSWFDFEEEGIVTEDRALCQKCIEKLEDE